MASNDRKSKCFLFTAYKHMNCAFINVNEPKMNAMTQITEILVPTNPLIQT